MYVNNSSHRLVSYSDSESISSNNQNSPLANMTGIKNLPTELIENIAFRLTAKDYGNFRQASKDFASKLESVKSMAEDYYNNDFSFTCKGELRENKSKLVTNSYGLYRCITAQASAKTLEALSSRYLYNHVDNLIWINQSYHIRHARNEDFLLLERLHTLPEFPDMDLYCRISHGIFCSFLVIDKNNDNQETIAAISNEADKLFMTDKRDKGLIIAAMMSFVYESLSQLRICSDEVLGHYRDAHPSMFLTGDCINRFTPR